MGSGGVVGQTLAHAIHGASTASANGAGMLGMLKGGGVAALGYAAYQAVSSGVGATMDKMDSVHAENKGLDQFRRSMGSASEGFYTLKSQVHSLAEEFHLTYEQSRKLTTEFASIAKVNSPGQVAEGTGLAHAVGLDESQGVNFMARMRHDGTLSEKQRDARILAVQFSEALKRTGSTLNAGELMHAIEGFSHSTSQRGLLAPNIEGFAGILSAMVGSKTPGLDVNNAASILNRADSAFQSGGRMGEASDTLQFMAMGGANTGLLGYKMRLAAGMFSTASGVLGNPKSQVNQYLGGAGMTRFGGNVTGLESVMGMFDNMGMSKESQLLGMGNHFGLNPEQAATLYNMRGSGQLKGTLSLFEKYKGTADIMKMSPEGIQSMADISGAGGDRGALQGIRKDLTKRVKTDEQRTALSEMREMKDPQKLEEALVKFASTLEREKTIGEQQLVLETQLSQDTQRMAEELIPAAQDSREFLQKILHWATPEDEREKLAEKRAEQERDIASVNAKNAEDVDNTGLTAQMASRLAKRGKKVVADDSAMGRAFKLLPDIAETERKNGLKSGEIAGLIQAESAFRDNVFGSQYDKDGNFLSSSAFGLGQMNEAAVRAATPEFERQFGHRPKMEHVKSPSGRVYYVPTDSKEQIQLLGIYKSMMNTENGKGSDSHDGNMRWKAGAKGLRGQGPDSKKMLDDYTRKIEKYQDDWSSVITPTAPQIPPGDPLSQLDNRRMNVQFSPANVFASIDVNTNNGYERQTHNVRSASVFKPLASGYYA